MESNEIFNAISSVGFPIVACVFCGYMIYKLQGIILNLTVTLEKLNERVGDIENILRKENK